MKTAYILVGVPAAGKSTWYKNFPNDPPSVYVSTDLFVEQEANRVGKTYNEVFEDYMPTAVELMADVVRKATQSEMDVVWDQTSVSVRSRKRKFQMLRGYWMIAVVFPTPPVEVLMKRLASRPGKQIPWEVVGSMINNFEMPTVEEGFDEIRIIN